MLASKELHRLTRKERSLFWNFQIKKYPKTETKISLFLSSLSPCGNLWPGLLHSHLARLRINSESNNESRLKTTEKRL
jgi:hypothetical protein